LNKGVLLEPTDTYDKGGPRNREREQESDLVPWGSTIQTKRIQETAQEWSRMTAGTNGFSLSDSTGDRGRTD
jgi:hypothetical protein